MAEIRAFAGYYCAMALGTEDDPELKAVFHDIHELKVDVAFPLLLELYHDYANQVLIAKMNCFRLLGLWRVMCSAVPFAAFRRIR